MPDDTNYDNDLSDLDEDYAAAPEPEDPGKVADGKYEVTVMAAEVTRSKTSGNAMLKWTLRIDGPTNKGRLLWRYNMLITQQNLTWLKGDLAACGIRLAKISDLPGRCDELVGLRLQVTQKTKGEFTNVYIGGLLKAAPAPAAAEAPASAGSGNGGAAAPAPASPDAVINGEGDEIPF